jgi:hypothetical protein
MIEADRQYTVRKLADLSWDVSQHTVIDPTRVVTGHTIASINGGLDRYTKLTADQAGAAVERRLAHENRVVHKLSAFRRR